MIGGGTARKQLEKIAGPKTRFLGHQPDEVVAQYAGRCRALIFPGEEDFGMTPIEINASGRPVIAFRAGGATETVINRKTGVFFEKQTVDSVVQGIEEFESLSWNRSELRRHAEKFDRTVFAARINQFLNKVAPAALSSELSEKTVNSEFTLRQGAV